MGNTSTVQCMDECPEEKPYYDRDSRECLEMCRTDAYVDMKVKNLRYECTDSCEGLYEKDENDKKYCKGSCR